MNLTLDQIEDVICFAQAVNYRPTIEAGIRLRFAYICDYEHKRYQEDYQEVYEVYLFMIAE